jgi:hypothetical protein
MSESFDELDQFIASNPPPTPVIGGVEEGIEIPEGRLVGRPQKYPFAEMKIGDSFFVSGIGRNTINSSVNQNRLRTGRRYTVKAVNNGFRVWRIA